MTDGKSKKPILPAQNVKSTEGMTHKQHKQRTTQVPRQVRIPRKSG